MSILLPSHSYRQSYRFFLIPSPRNLLLFSKSVMPLPSSASVVLLHCRRTYALRCHPAQHSGVAASIDDGYGFLDTFFFVAEVVCLVSTAVAAGVVLGLRRCGGVVGDGVLVWIVAGLISGALSGSLVRMHRLGWGRGEGDGEGLSERVDRLEEEARSLRTMVKVLSRQLEKLGIRFRVTWKSLKEPIAQEDVLEKELREIQKVLLAMQEQQQKQLDLILAIGKTSKLWDSERGASRESIKTKSFSVDEAGLKQIEINQHKVEPSLAGGADYNISGTL